MLTLLGPSTTRRHCDGITRRDALRIGALGIGAFVCLVAAVGDAVAAPADVAPPTLSVSIQGATAPDQISDTLKIVLVLTAISVAPSLLLMATCFTRILIVLALIRQALGTATLPPNQVLVSLALMTTIYVMAPVGETVYAESIEPYGSMSRPKE